MTETEHMQQTLNIIADMGQKERKWIKDNSRMALAQGRPTMFNKELNNQIVVHEQRLKAIRQIFARCNEEALCHCQADPSALKRIGTVTDKSVNHCVKLVMILEKHAILNNSNPPYSYWHAKLHPFGEQSVSSSHFLPIYHMHALQGSADGRRISVQMPLTPFNQGVP